MPTHRARGGAGRGSAAAVAAALAAADPPALAAALGEDAVPLHAAMTMPIAPVDSPRTVALWMNSRRLRRPAAKASTTSSCSGTALRRTLSNSE